MSAIHGDYFTVGFAEHVADLNHGGGPEMGDEELTRLAPSFVLVGMVQPRSDAFCFYFILS